MTKVAFLGLGVMGSRMAARLLDAGFTVTAWTRRAERAEPLGAKGATIAGSPRDAAWDADVVISMVADDAASRDVWLGERGALAGTKRGALGIEASTLSPAWIVELAEHARTAGITFIDAPVTGSRPQAESGEIVFLAGGDREDVERVRPVLKPMSRDVVHIGPVGSGARMKLVNNVTSAVQAVALAEALAFIEACGLEPTAAMSVITNGAPGSPLVKTLAPRMLLRDYEVNFQLALMRKDITYAIEEARRCGVELGAANAARSLFDAALAAGLGDADFSAIAEAVEGKPKSGE